MLPRRRYIKHLANMSPRGQRRRTPTFLVLLLTTFLLQLSTGRAAEVGYGPLFDPCGDNCQTQMVNFCTVGHDIAQMRTCWCDDAEYIERMDACLDSCDPALGKRATQKDQMLRYRRIVCEPAAITKDVEFQQYYRTRFASVDGGSFTPEVTRGIPPPTASPVEITGEVTLAPESSSDTIGSSSSSEFVTNSKVTPTSIITLTISTTPTASSFVTALPSTAAADLTLQKKGLSTAQLFGVIFGTAAISVLLSLSIVFCIRRQNPRRPFWNPPPPPPLPRPSTTSFLPYYTPTSPPPTILPQRIEPHAIATSTASTHSTGEGDSTTISPTRGRGGYSYSQLESPILPTPPQSQFYARPITASTRMLTPVVAYAQAMIQVTSSSAIAAAAAAERNSRGSTHTLIEPEPQQAILEGTMVDRSRSQSRPGNSGVGRTINFDESGYCPEDDSTASCSSWSERSWCEEEDDVWWDLRESQMMGP